MNMLNCKGLSLRRDACVWSEYKLSPWTSR